MALADERDEEEELPSALQLQRRQLSAAQVRIFEGYMAEIFNALGLDLATPATRETPRRHVRALFDATEGYDGDVKLLTVFATECRGRPIVRWAR